MAEDLVASGEIARMLNVSRTRADQLTRQKGFPEPAAEIDTGGRVFRAWRRSSVRQWADSLGREVIERERE